MEWTLQRQGFDLCYDKRLYDRLVHDGPGAVRDHLRAERGYQERLLRFIENHDEPRAAATFAPGPARAAAVVMVTLPGGRLCTTASSTGVGPTSPCSCDACPTSRWTPTCTPSTAGCCGPWPTAVCATATGGCARPRAGPTTTPTAARRLVLVDRRSPPGGRRQPRVVTGAGSRAPGVGRPQRPGPGVGGRARRPPLRGRRRCARRRWAVRGTGRWGAHFLAFEHAASLSGATTRRKWEGSPP